MLENLTSFLERMLSDRLIKLSLVKTLERQFHLQLL